MGPRLIRLTLPVWLGILMTLPGRLSGAAAAPLEWTPFPGGRLARLNVPPSPTVGFTQITNAAAGIRFTNLLSFEKSSANQNLLNGAGLAVGDYDGDGWCDVYFCNLEGRNGLYRNLGQWRFEDVTDHAGVGCAEQPSTGAAFADVNGDGQLDLLVTSCGAGNRLFLNLGSGRFQERLLPPGILTRTGSTTLALADVDGDGDLDLYIANYGENSILRTGGAIATRFVNGQEVVVGRYRNRVRLIDGKMIELGEPDVLYLNDGQGGFTPVSWTDGHFLDEHGRPLTEGPWDQGLTALFHDLNRDGAPDLYVCNDFQTPDQIWLNDGQGRFRAISNLAIRSTCNFAMTTDIADINRDGHYDIFVADMLSRYHELRMRQMDGAERLAHEIGPDLDRHQIRRNVLFLNRGDGTYADIANYARLDASDWTWCAAWLDVDLDGYEDLVTGNGHAFDTQDLDAFEQTRRLGRRTTAEKQESLQLYPNLETPNTIFRHRGDLTFEETGQAWGYASTQVTHSVAFADFDNDGDLDLALNCLNAPPVLYRNVTPAPRVAIRLKGTPPNGQGIGAHIVVRGGAIPYQSQEVIAGGRYLSGSDPLRVFAAATPTNALTLEITWRNGQRSRLEGARPNALYLFNQSDALPPAPPEPAPESAPHFREVTTPQFRPHPEAPFNDFERQPLLHRMYSRLGPGVAWLDLDNDGHDDLVVGAGRGGTLAVYRGDGRGHWQPWSKAAWASVASDDFTSLVGWVSAAGHRTLLTGLASYEQSAGTPSTLLHHDPRSPDAQTVAQLPHSVGPLAVADVDGDGDLDLFAGGRVIPGRYPEPPISVLYRNQQGRLSSDPAYQAALKNAGMVSGAVFSDLTGDGLPELVLACEWGPVRIFRNTAGTLQEATESFGLADAIGWWNSVGTGDFDGDGRLDIVAGNWGLNSSSYQPTAAAPLRLYYGDFDGNGSFDLLEAWTDLLSGQIVPRRDLLVAGSALPLLRARFGSHAAYARATPAAIIGDSFPQARQCQAHTLASMVFLNRGNRFVAVPLPPEAQFSPAIGLAVADFDGDGHEDLFLSQNYAALRIEEPRLDSGRGLWLRGNGNGQFQPVPGPQAGIAIYREQRAAAFSDFDEDGRVDLVVAQNGAEPRLYRNQQARPGLRVRLRGPATNPDGIGAQLRLHFPSGSRPGPVREIQGGSGYWTQNSTVAVLSMPQPPTELWVRWPAGAVTTFPLPPGAREVAASLNGALQVLR